jgi:hypothetical protein
MSVTKLLNSLSPIIVGAYRKINLRSRFSVKSTVILMEAANQHLIKSNLESVKFSEVLADLKTGHCFTGNYSVITESSSWPSKELTKGNIPRPFIQPKSINIGDKTLLLTSSGFYHWLLEDLPGVIKVINQETNFKIVVYKNPPKYVKDFLEICQIPSMYLDRFSKIQNLYVPIKKQNVGEPSLEDIEILRSFFLKKLSNSGEKKKIYISRANSSRSPKFERELQDALKERGWTILYLEHLSLLNQIETFKDAAIVMGAHGAGLSGMIFTDRGTPIIEMYPKDRDIKCFENIAKVTRQDLRRVCYEPESNEIPSSLMSTIDS